MIFHKVLVVMNVWLDVKPVNKRIPSKLKYATQLRIASTMEKTSHIKGLKMVIHFCKKNNLTIRPIIFYGTVLIRHRVTIFPTNKPIILGYWEYADADSHTHKKKHMESHSKIKLAFIIPIILCVIYTHFTSIF